MRLLAYGGDRYAERRRIGSWPPIPPGALYDTYGLTSGTIAFGLGLLEQQPFLIVRQGQKQDQRFYTYSLLLDPGVEVWERFGWNGAALALALFGGFNAPGQSLLSNPEDITEERLARLLQSLDLPAMTRLANDAFLALWVGSIFSPTTVVASPGSLGFGGVPSLDQIASLLGSLPECLRGGLGWLVGGGKEHAEAFGAKLVLDTWLTSGGIPTELSRRGHEIISVWNAIAGDSQFKYVVEQRAAVPLWEWKTKWGFSLEEFFDRLALLSTLLDVSSLADSTLENLDELLTPGGPLEREIRDAARRSALAGTGSLSRSRTLLLLRDAFAARVKPNEQTIKRLDVPTVITEHIRRGIPPSRSPLALPGPIRLQIWRQLIGQEQEPTAIASLVRSAIGDLESANEPITPEHISELVQAAIEKTSATTGLVWWLSLLRENRSLRSRLEDFLQQQAIERLRARSKDWPRDYLVFGQDEGGARLAELPLSLADVSQLINDLIDEVQHQGPFCQEAQQWLISLARSPLRKQIPLRDRIRIAQLVDKGWEALRSLHALYSGQSEVDVTASRLDEAERDLVLFELRQMMREPASSLPNLQGLVEFIGDLPEEVVEDLSRLQPAPASGAGVKHWLEGWHRLGRPDVAEREAVRLLIETDRSESYLLDQLKPEGLGQVFDRLLFGGQSEDDELYRNRFERLAARSDDRLHQAIATALDTCWNDEAKQETFLRRLAWHKPTLNILLESVSEPTQDRVMTLLAQHDGDRFMDEAYALYRLVLEAQPPKSAYTTAMLRFLLSRQGDEIKKQIGIWYHGLLDADHVEKNIREILGVSPADQPTGSATAEVSEAGRSSWPRRIKEVLVSFLPQHLRNRLADSSAASSLKEPEQNQTRQASVPQQVETGTNANPKASIETLKTSAEETKEKIKIGKDEIV